MNIGGKIKELRIEKELTQIELAKILKVDKSTIAKYETGKSIPSTYMIIELAKFFEVSSDYILGLEE